MRSVNWIDLIGYLASLLVLFTFSMKTMIPLRTVAVLSNVAFIAYGLAAMLWPVLILHAILLPLNCLRLFQMRALIAKVRQAVEGNLSLDWLIPLMSRRRLGAGEVLFHKGDEANWMCLILSGSIGLEGTDIVLGPGSLLGEIGLFSPHRRRTLTAVTRGETEIGTIDDGKVLQLYYQNPTFGLYLVKLLIERLLQNNERLLSQIAPAPALVKR